MSSTMYARRPTVEPMRGPVTEVDEAIERLDALATVMDSIVKIPGTNVRIGVDALLGLVPVIGDIASQAISGYLIWEARRLGASKLVIGRMIANSAIDTVVGAVPFLGDAFDIAFRANKRNVALLKTHLHDRRRRDVIEGDFRRVG
jgi:hypothetical protein